MRVSRVLVLECERIARGVLGVGTGCRVIKAGGFGRSNERESERSSDRLTERQRDRERKREEERQKERKQKES